MKKKIPLEAREGYAINQAYIFLNEFKRLTLPVDLSVMCAFHDIILMTYSQLSKHGKELGIKNTTKFMKRLPNDGFVMMINDTPYIFYNERRKSKNRIRFTIAHEIGHVILGHLDDFDLSILRREEGYSKQYKVLEDEANNFARNILTPFPFLTNISLDEHTQWFDFFQITSHAAKVRRDLIRKDRNLVLPEVRSTFVKKFNDLINLPIRFRECKQCGHKSFSHKKSYCTFCGSARLLKIYPRIGDVNMIYPGVFEKDGKVNICPICFNQEILDDANHCSQCGIYLLNHCSDYNYSFSHGMQFGCLDSLPLNSRYCHVCGNPSTFLKNGLLQDWKETQQDVFEQERIDAEANCNNYANNYH